MRSAVVKWYHCLINSLTKRDWLVVRRRRSSLHSMQQYIKHHCMSSLLSLIFDHHTTTQLKITTTQLKKISVFDAKTRVKSTTHLLLRMDHPTPRWCIVQAFPQDCQHPQKQQQTRSCSLKILHLHNLLCVFFA